MDNVIIVAVLVVMLGIGIRYTVKHFRHESGCCGGGTYKARKKKLDKVIGKKTFGVAGMSCQHCVNRVQEAVNDIEGAAGVVNLKKGIVVVSMSHEISDEVIVSAIERYGYNVTGVIE